MNLTPRERLHGGDLRFLAICLSLLALTTWFSVRYFYRAFPEASIDFRVNRDQSTLIAGQFLRDRGLDAARFQHASRFDYDGEAKTFLERELGLERANQLMGSQVRLWRWAHRWFRPQQKEEFNVGVTPKGEIAEFSHLIPEDAPRPSLDQGAARAAAERYLRDVLARDPAALEFVEGSTTTRPARTDHAFTWQLRGFDVRDAKYRVEITVLGAEIGGFREFLKIPEKWSRDFERLRSKNAAAQTVDTALTVLLGAALLAMIAVFIRRHNIRWRQSLVVGGIGATLLFLSNWNSFPLREYSYPTTDSYASFVAQQLLQSLLSAVGAGVLLAILTAGAEPLYREFLGRHLSLGNLFAPRGLLTRHFFRGSILGLSLTGIFVAYQIAFYMLAYRFGAWSPADVPYDDLLNTRFPWLYVLFGGFLPAVSEEFLFRMFAIPFLKKLVRSLWIAILLAGFLWGFGHAGYPQQPFWIRGVEVGIGGVVLGVILLKWGILPALVWHYSVDAMYSALLLARSDNLYFKLSALACAGIMVLPAAFALIAYWRRGCFEPEEGLRNQDQPAPPAASGTAEAAPHSAAIAYTPLNTTRRVAALGATLLAAALAFVPVEHFASRPRFEMPEASARDAASRFLLDLGLKPDSYRVAATPADSWPGSDALAAKYLLDRLPLAEVNALFQRNRPPNRWRIRYYRPLEKDEVNVTVHPETGRVLSFNHQLPEDAPGDDLAVEQARALADAFAAARGTDVGAMDVQEMTSEVRKARRDHQFVWEARAGDPRNVAEARYRLEIGVGGSRITGWRGYWKIPESFERARSERNFVSIGALGLRIVVISLVAAFALWLLIDATRQKRLPWARPIRWSAVLTLLGAVSSLLGLGLMYVEYPTAIPLSTYQTMVAAMSVITAAGMMLLFAALSGLLFALHPDAHEWLGRAARRLAGFDALLAALFAAALAAALPALRAIAEARFPALALPRAGYPEIVASAFPALSALTDAALSAFSVLAVAAVLFRFAAGRSPALVVPFGLAVLAGTLPGAVHTPAEFAFYFAIRFIQATAVITLCLCFARRNLLAYTLAAWSFALTSGAAGLFAQHNPRLAWHGAALVAVLFATLVFAAYPARVRDN